MSLIARALVVGAIATLSCASAAQSDSCLNSAADLAALEVCVQREIVPLEKEYVRGAKALLSRYPDAKADIEGKILQSRDDWRRSNCAAEGKIQELRSGGDSALEMRRGFAVCQKRTLQAMLKALADCERTASRCEHATSIEAAGAPAVSTSRTTIPRLTETQKKLLVDSDAASAQARTSYCAGSLLQAVGDVERSIALRERAQAEVWSAVEGAPTVLNYGLVLQHARLAKLHSALGNPAQSEKHETIARNLKIGDKSIPDPLTLVADDDRTYCAARK